MKIINKKIFIAIFSILLFPFASQASTLYFDPVEGQHGQGDTFTVNIKLDIDEQCINTVEGTISFPKDILRIVDFSAGQSILNLWLDNPSEKDLKKTNDDGLLYFAGGIPGGYCGKIPGDPGVNSGESNIIGKIVFTVSNFVQGNDPIKNAHLEFVPETSVLINDGQGTKDKLITKAADFKITGKQPFIKNEWQDEVKTDKILPEPFIVELQRDPNKEMFNGHYYIIFNTEDKQTGIDRYEALEIRPNTNIGEETKLSFWEKITGKKAMIQDWKVATSPYQLEDQDLKSTIKIKAIDKAGNERIVEYVHEQKVSISGKVNVNFLYYFVGAVLILILSVVTWKLKRKK